MTTFSRTDTSVLGNWWWTVDRWSLAAIVALIAFGTMLTLASSPAVALKMGYDSLHFVTRHLIFLPFAAIGIIFVSLLTPTQIRRYSVLAFLFCILGLALTLLIGKEAGGAQRWLSIAGQTLQVTEFAKPTFAVVTAWLFAEKIKDKTFPGYALAIISLGILISLVLIQPDLGQSFVIGTVWMEQLCLAGLPIWIVASLFGLGIAGLFSAYLFMDHVQRRINGWYDASSGSNYQGERSLDAFANGGLFGRGPGEGTVKNSLPDAHADMVFAVAGEELGLIIALIIVFLFAFIVLRGLIRAMGEDDLFTLLAACGLLGQFGLQTLINMASSLQLMPAKGMTLPFISYGGSSLLAIALSVGMILSLTRRRSGKARNG